MTDDTVLITGGMWFVITVAATYMLGRENRQLRRELDTARMNRANVDTAASALRDTLRKVWRDRRHAQYQAKLAADEAAATIAKLAGVVRRLWNDRRTRQYLDGTARTEGYMSGLGDAARVMHRNADRRLADARSLAMCEELY